MASPDRIQRDLDILTQPVALLAVQPHGILVCFIQQFVPGWTAHEHAQQPHDLDVILIRPFFGEDAERINANETTRKSVAPK